MSNNYQIQENFEGNNLDSDLWEAMTYPRGYRNNEEQSYTPSQISVNDGHLKINAKRDSAGNWLSGEVHSKWAYTYGEFETRIALSAKGAGVWPAAWMLGTGKQWPTGGEIDLFESINNELAVYGTIHGDGANGHWQLQNYLYGIDSTRYHTYKIVKDPGTISWWVDGIKRREWRQADMPNGAAWPFENNKNYVLLNLAIGGTWPGPSNDSTPSNITMMIDYFTVKNGR